MYFRREVILFYLSHDSDFERILDVCSKIPEKDGHLNEQCNDFGHALMTFRACVWFLIKLKSVIFEKQVEEQEIQRNFTLTLEIKKKSSF